MVGVLFLVLASTIVEGTSTSTQGATRGCTVLQYFTR